MIKQEGDALANFAILNMCRKGNENDVTMGMPPYHYNKMKKKATQQVVYAGHEER